MNTAMACAINARIRVFFL